MESHIRELDRILRNHAVNVRAAAASRPTIILAAIAALALSLMYLVRPAMATEISTFWLHESQQNSDSSQMQDSEEDCKGADVPAGMVLWHFILNKLDAGTAEPGALTATFTGAGTVGPIDSYKLTPGGVMHWNVFTTGD
ncbi:MAG: hypothetical protein ABI978_02305, partial [Chloroflexota bacterium]